MSPPTSRRRFLVQTSQTAALAAAGLAVAPSIASAEPPAKPRIGKFSKKPLIELDLVEEFVGASHRDLSKIKGLLEKEPGLINSANDWGAGDWETGLGAASHMGRADIAIFLLERGARLDIFAAAMLGRLDIVKAAIIAYPDIVNVPGPHRIPLIKHAEVGGKAARPVLDLLRSLED